MTRIEEHVLGEIVARRYCPTLEPEYALVISHGLGGHGDMYDRFGTHHAARGVDVWSYHAPGHGKSAKTRPKGQFTLEEWTQASVDYAEHVAATTGVPVFVVGSSLGVAATYSALACDAAEGAILMGAATVPGSPFLERLAEPLRSPALDALVATYGRSMRFDLDIFVDYDTDYGYDGAAAQKKLDPWITWSYDLASWMSLARYQPPVPIGENTKPILVIAGDQDVMFPPDTIREAAAAIAGPVDVEILPDGSHQLLMFDTQRFSDAVDVFVRRHIDGRTP